MKFLKQKSALKVLSIAGGLVLGVGLAYATLVTGSSLGDNLIVKDAGTFNTGNSSTEVSISTGGDVNAVSFTYKSDRNLKKNIVPLAGQLEKISQLQGVSFDWKNSDKHSIGLIAQDIEKVYPDLVSTNETTGLKSVQYGNLVAPLIEAVKEQQKQIDALKAENDSLKARLEKLENK